MTKKEVIDLIVFGSSNVGKVRKDNQDSYLFDTKNKESGFAVVCDGMGGASGGKTASLLAVNTFASNLACLNEAFDETQILTVLKQAVDAANSEIYSKAQANDELKGMGTTLVASVIVNNIAFFVNVGDSRAYLIRDGILKRITKDHSAVQELVDQGILTESQARNHPNRNIITRALGVSSHVDFDFFKENLLENDIIILCSDGIVNYIDDLEIPFEILKQPTIESVPQKLIELANSRGGSDNSTVVVIKV